MGQKRSREDERLIRDLYRKLEWMTFQAKEEEFDAQQVKAILNLLDALDPLPERTEADLRKAARARDGREPGRIGAETIGGEGRRDIPLSDPKAAFERFKQRYGISEGELAKKGGPDGTPGPGKIVPFSGEFSGETVYRPEEAAKDCADGPGTVQSGPAEPPTNLGADLPDSAAMQPDLKEGRESEGMSSGKTRGRRNRKPSFRSRLRRALSTAPGKIAAGFLIVLCGITFVGIGTSAVQQKAFFEIVRDGVNSMKITVTGNTMESETSSQEVVYDDTERVYYDSWDEVKEENPDIMTPGYIPEGLELEELYGEDYGSYRTVVALYGSGLDTDEMIIEIRIFGQNYGEVSVENEEQWLLIDSDDFKEIYYYRLDDCYKASWENDSSLYVIKANSLKELYETVKRMI